MNTRALKLLLGGLLLGSSYRAFAQEGMPPWAWPEVPKLQDGGGPREIVTAIQQRLIYPPEARRSCITGRTFIKFWITPTGEVRQAVVVHGIWPPFDSAAVRAVRQLPCFRPRPKAAGDLSYVVPVVYDIGGDFRRRQR